MLLLVAGLARHIEAVTPARDTANVAYALNKDRDRTSTTVGASSLIESAGSLDRQRRSVPL
ncbi:MAG: hypothetical protein JWR32_3246 [Mycobacterium sp.]|jgi:hypothetical protein|nr:hypothetical protein [Mycobacterium sp.]